MQYYKRYQKTLQLNNDQDKLFSSKLNDNYSWRLLELINNYDQSLTNW